MEFMIAKLLKLFILLVSLKYSESYDYCVLNTNSSACITAQYYCDRKITLEQIEVESFSASFYFCSENYEIDTKNVTHFTNLNSVTITGVSGGSRLNCHNDNYGFYFKNVRKIEINNMIFNQCGFSNTAVSTLIANVLITDSSNIVIDAVKVNNSSGIGVILENNSGYINISQSAFANNCGGGVLIEFLKGDITCYSIKKCSFTENGVLSGNGGLTVHFNNETTNVNVYITDCVFGNNTGWQGGALSLSYNNSVHDVMAIVERSHFKYNTAQKGGAVSAGYIHDSEKMNNNIVKFHFCNFTNNQAYQGGGVELYSAPDYSNKSKILNTIVFEKCVWEYNVGTYGSAVFISPYTSIKFPKNGKFPIPFFKDCQFIDNYNRNKKTKILHYGRGAFYVSFLKVNFLGESKFQGNGMKSAVYLFSSILEVGSKSSILFKENAGHQGGALHLREFSSLHLNDDTSMIFLSNHATDKGGAIFHEARNDPSESTVLLCFIKYVGTKTGNERNVTVYLSNNTIPTNLTTRGQSIFLFSVKPCRLTPQDQYSMLTQTLMTIANFSFKDGIQNDTIATYPSNFSINCNPPKTLVPGKVVALNMHATDDMNNQVLNPTFKIQIDHENTYGISVDQSYTITKNNMIKLHGRPGSNGTILISIHEHEDVVFPFNVTLEECPPGYVYNGTNTECMCSVNTEKLYTGIKRCNLATFQANLVKGFWVGYIKDLLSPRESTFRISHCPRGFCKKSGSPEIILPDSIKSDDELNDFICAENRTGVMCGQCKNNTSVYFHTLMTLDCRSDDSCHLGILWYLLSEILPTTILFLVIILLNVKLTTGALNGLLFYMQVINKLNIGANNFVVFPTSIEFLLDLLHSITSMFNLDFFVSSKLSFCIIKGANPFYLLIVDYFTITYSLLLIILTVGVLKSGCNKYLAKFAGRRFNITHSVIYGLSGFLIICYAKATSISLSILKRVYTHGYVNGTAVKEERVFYYGDWTYFGKEHSKYAIPSIFSLLVMTCLPPLLLLIYPLCYKVLEVLRLEESKFTKILCRVIPLEKFKPFFDTFQGTFKDKHRYFAGLFFLYRLLILVFSSTVHSLTDFYLYLEVQFVLMLLLHGWMQPYKYNRHNLSDMCIFTLLIIINRITLHNYRLQINLYDRRKNTTFLFILQVILAYTPLVLLIAYIVVKLNIKAPLVHIWRKIRKHKDTDVSELTLSMLDRGRQRQSSNMEMQL